MNWARSYGVDEVTMKDRNTAIWATAASAILCGCPGIFLGMTGFVIALGQTDIDINFIFGILFVAFGIGFVLIPIGIGLYNFGPTRRKKRAQVEDIDEPLPPAI